MEIQWWKVKLHYHNVLSQENGSDSNFAIESTCNFSQSVTGYWMVWSCYIWESDEKTALLGNTVLNLDIVYTA